MEGKAYFLTVDRCGKGSRGVFCSKEGTCFRRDDRPHTEDEMWEILDAFALVLNPQSEPFTESQVKEFSKFTSFGEYSHQYGVALKGL